MHDPQKLANFQGRLTLALIGLIAVIFYPTTGTSDIFDWLDWGKNVHENGLVQGYIINHHEHPPYFSLALYLAYAVAKTAGVEPFYGIKFTFLLFLFASCAIIYFWSKRNAALTLIFFIPLAYSCLALSYMDIFFTPFLILSIYHLSKKNIFYASMFFVFAAMMKYPVLIIAPFFVVYMISIALQAKNSSMLAAKEIAIKSATPAALSLLVTYLIFGTEPYMALTRAFQHNCLTCNAMNFNKLSWMLYYNFLTEQTLWSALINETIPITSLNQSFEILDYIARASFMIFYVTTLATFFFTTKNIHNFLVFSIAGHLCYFTLSKGVHENHLYLSMILAICLAITDSRFLAMALNIAVISSLNLFVSYGINGMGQGLWWDKAFYPNELPSLSWLNAGYPIDMGLLLSIFHTTYFLLFWFYVIVPPLKIFSRKST